MSAPLSFCDISARYGQTPAPQQTIEELTGWNPKQLFTDYLYKVHEQREQDAKEAEEDALMAMVDAMNASEEDKASGKVEETLTNSLANAGKAIVAQNEEVLEDGTKQVTWVDPTQSLTVQVLLSCLGDRATFEQADQVQENQEEARQTQKQEIQEERLEVTETRDPSDPGDPNKMKKEV